HSDNNLLAEFTGTLNDTTFLLEHGRVDIVFESDAQPCNGGFDLSYTATTIGVVEHTEQGLRSWPNPASTTLHLQTDEPLLDVEIFDLQGRKVWSCNIQDSQCDIPVADWTAGLYFVKARTSMKTITTKFIKQ
ncbi:MAG: T9SS type A sorting domain-containing protein, partial [Bacteroidales bacterium]|nr:T9SS type A sorting domain-containing protein [Bacteroidales bacterium]